MIEIDGSFGEGGGQILRSSVALSAITGQPVSIMNIRAKRKKPGLMRQHFAAIQAASKICDAKVEGLALHSTALTFAPQGIKGGEYKFSIGTAGSTSLVLQTVLLPLLLADSNSTVRLEGGTHNEMAPTFDFIDKSYLPQLRSMGADIRLKLGQYGFFPAGGGQMTASISPIRTFQALQLDARGDQLSRNIRAISSRLPNSIGQRELKRIQTKSDWPWSEMLSEPNVRSHGPGNVVSIELAFENVCAVFTGFGKIGRRAETVADDALRLARGYLKNDAPVEGYLADQLLLPMAIAANRDGVASQFVTQEITGHTSTHVELIKKFMCVSIEVTPNENTWQVSVRP